MTAAKRPPIVRLPPKSNFELILSRGSQIALILVGLTTLAFILYAGKFILAPIGFAVVVGLMLGPIANRLERWGVPFGVSAAVVVLAFIVIISALMLAIAAPLTLWSGRLPQLWMELQLQLASFREPLQTISDLRDQLRDATGEGGGTTTVEVQEGSTVENVAMLAPALIAQVLLFFAGLYFFVATRHDTRIAILRLCFNRRLRWRVAHIFRDVEWLVSRYLLSITVINLGLGIAVAFAMWLVGVPSPLLWGALAALLNFVIYLGPAVMALILFGVGLTTYDTLSGSLMPPLVYLAVNMIEAQFVTPTVIGRTLTMNPFVIFLALAFWLWIWGPVGGFVAIPALLIAYAIGRNILPGLDWMMGETDTPR